MQRTKNLAIAGGLLAAYWIIGSVTATPVATAQGNKPVTEVAVVNEPTVRVSNLAETPLHVRNLDERGRQPFQWVGRLQSASGCGQNFCDPILPAVPDGKRLVITHFSASLLLDQNTNPAPLRTSLQDGPGQPLFDLPQHAGACYADTLSGNNIRCHFSAQVNLYAEPGTQLRIFNYVRGSLASGPNQLFVVTGYLVDINS